MENHQDDMPPVQPDESISQRSFTTAVAELTTAGLLTEGVKYGLVHGVGAVADKMRPHGKHQGQSEHGSGVGDQSRESRS